MAATCSLPTFTCYYKRTNRVIHRQMSGENRPLVTDDPVEFEKQPVEVQDFRKIAHHYWRNPWNIPQITKAKLKDHNL